jgi:cobalt-zinc-cadmium efflux system protein
MSAPHSHGHSHGHHHHALPTQSNARRLWWALWLTGGFLIAEVIGALLTGSLALLSDAAHMFTDTAALGIALAAVRIGKRPADVKRTFGYQRFEILAAAFNAMLLFVVAGYILVEAYIRLQSPTQIESLGMLIVATLGLVTNLISMRLLAGGRNDSLNVKGAYLEVWSDMLGSLGVIVGAMAIRLTGWTWIDSVVAVAIGLWVLPRTWALLKETLHVLLEGVPEGVDLPAIDEALRGLTGVCGLHDLHIWSISTGRTNLTVHVVYDPSLARGEELLRKLRATLEHGYGIRHVTVQLEEQHCQTVVHDHSAAHQH